MISRGVEISIAGGEEEMVRVITHLPSFSSTLLLFFCFFLNSCVICFRYKKPYAP